MAEETIPTQVVYIENTQPYTVIDISEITTPFYVEFTDTAHDSNLIELEDVPIAGNVNYIEDSQIFNIIMDSSGRDGKDGTPGKDGIGLPGKDGANITFESLTPEQLELLQKPATEAATDLYTTVTRLEQALANLPSITDWFYLDTTGNVCTNYNLYSTKEISAWKLGQTENISIYKLESWGSYTIDKSDYYVPASLLVPLETAINDYEVRITALEGGSGGSGAEWGIESDGYVPLTVGIVTKSLALPTHKHLVSDITNISNHSHTKSQITDFPSTMPPTSHAHGNISNTGYIGSTANLILITTTGGLITTKPAGSAGQFLNYLGNWDTPSNITYGLVSTTTNGLMSKEDKIKLNGVATGATANVGTVTSVGLTVPTGLSITGSPITASGTLVIGLASGYSIPTTADQNKWTLAYNHSTVSGDSTIHHVHSNKSTLDLINQSLATTANVTFNSLLSTVSVTTAKVIFNATGWSLLQSGTELLIQYNGVTKQRMLSDGSFAAVGEISAFVAGTSGYSDFLPLIGGTMTGPLILQSDLGNSATPLTLKGNSFKYNTYDVLHKGNIGSSNIVSIGFANGWTIEQLGTNLLIKQGTTVKGTF